MKIKKILLLLAVSIVFVFFLFVDSVAFAEGDTVCNGKISGVTPVYNLNSGQVSFDAHPNENKPVSLDIVGLSPGLAPLKREHAACVSEESGVYSGQAYKYAIKGWAWDTNLGFISFNCSSGKNNAGDGLGVDCGLKTYGVYINSTGQLFGHAWSPSIGYIQFNGSGVGGAFTYGVKRQADGFTSGYAWTDAKIYIDFSGLYIELPDQAPAPDVNSDWCNGKPWLCIQIKPAPEVLKPFDPSSGVTVDTSVDEYARLADGNDGYYIHLYLREADGVTPLDPAKYNLSSFLDSIVFDWDDTVKIDQTFKKPKNEIKDLLDNIFNPWDQGLGAVTFKPINYSTTNFVPVSGEPGHYVTSKKIASHAPTTGAKMSFTTSTKPAYGIKNDEFLFDIGKGLLEPNELILKGIYFDDLIENATGKKVLKKGAVYPNGEINLAFGFRPPIVVDKLYANDLQDSIVAYRSIPINFKVSLKILSDYIKSHDDLKNSAKATFALTYSQDETQKQPSCQGNSVLKDFLFNFISGFSSSASDAPVSELSNITVMDKTSQDWDLQAIATLPSCTELDKNGKCKDQPDKLPCGIAKGSNLYTVIEWGFTPKVVKYYDNRLPRIAGDAILNPVIVVHGNIFAQAAANLRSDVRVQSSGNVNLNLVRDAVNENLKKYTTGVLSNSSVDCKITSLKDSASVTTDSGTGSCQYTNFKVVNKPGTTSNPYTADDENVLYFKDTNVTVALGSSGNWTGNWAIISDGGNIFVDSNIYNSSNANYLSLIAFRKNDADYFKTGHIYLAPCSSGVKNVKANIMVDGSLFSYDGNHAHIDNQNGEPKWSNYTSMIDGLNCQLLMEGTIYSDNTVGGADMDQGSDPKDYLLGGGGKIIKLPANTEQRMKAQYYDLNYLRLFRLVLQTNDEGLPIDQKCGKGWTAEDQKKLVDIEQGLVSGSLCGEKPCNPANMTDKNACDGIDPLNKYDKVTGSGDLIFPSSGSNVVPLGLNSDEDFDPVYVFYRAPMKGSFVFSKKGAINVGGN